MSEDAIELLDPCLSAINSALLYTREMHSMRAAKAFYDHDAN